MNLERKKRYLIIFIAVVICCTLTALVIFNEVNSKKVDVTLNFTNKIAFYINEDISVPVGEYLLYAASITQSTEKEYGEDVWSESVTLDDGSTSTFEDYTKTQIVEQIRMTRLLCLKADDYSISLNDEEKQNISKDAEDYLKSISTYNVGDAGIDLSTVLTVYQENALAEKVYAYILASVKKEEGDNDDAYNHEKYDYFTREYEIICEDLSPDWSYEEYVNVVVLSDLSFAKNIIKNDNNKVILKK